MAVHSLALRGGWFGIHKGQILAHGLILAGFLVYLVFFAEPVFNWFEAVPGAARLQQVQLPPETDDIMYRLEKVVSSSSALEIHGWAFVKGRSAADSKTFLVLRSDTRTYIFDSFARYIPYLNDQYGESSLSLEWSAFISTIPIRKIEQGSYAIGFYVARGEAGSLQFTDRLVVKDKGGVKAT